jgi:hypothetical protein
MNTAVTFVVSMVTLAFTAWTLQWWLCIFIGLSIAVIIGIDAKWPFVPRKFKDLKRNLPFVAPPVILFATLVIVLFMSVLFRQDTIAKTKEELREIIEKSEKLGPLFAYFQDDQFGEFGASAYLVSSSVTHGLSYNILLPFTLYFDSAYNAYVISMYIPPISDKNTFSNIMQAIPATYRQNFKDFLNIAHFSEAPPGRPAWTSDAAVFSGKMYLYHENVVSQDDLATYRLLFSKNGLDVEFRGPAYLSYKTGGE